MFEFFHKEGSVRQTSRILWETWLCENYDAWKRFNSRVEKPQAFDESSHCGLCRLWVHDKTNSKKTRLQNNIKRTNPQASAFLLFTTGKNWNRFCIQNNLRMKTWLKYFVKDFGTILKKFGLLKLNQWWWQRMIKSTLITQHNVGFAKKILPRKIKKFAITVILVGNTEVLLIKNVTHFSGNQNLCLWNFIISLAMTLICLLKI